jgi:hypothetical protein
MRIVTIDHVEDKIFDFRSDTDVKNDSITTADLNLPKSYDISVFGSAGQVPKIMTATVP